MEKKRKVVVTIDNKIIEKLEKIKKETGVPIAKQIELHLRGYTIKSR